MTNFRFRRALTPTAALVAVALAGAIPAALADDDSAAGHAMAGHDHSRMQAASGQGHDHAQGMGQHDPQTMQRMMAMPGHRGDHMAAGAIASPGQDAFGAIQEIVRRLEADPTTDWSKVKLEALRQHLVDMNEVTLKADAAEKPVDGGLAIEITGSGRTLAAIQRMIPAHAQELDRMNGWRAKTEPLANGTRVTVTSGDAKQVEHIRGLGFIGLLVSGAHHQPHHLAMAKGEFPHEHR